MILPDDLLDVVAISVAAFGLYFPAIAGHEFAFLAISLGLLAVTSASAPPGSASGSSSALAVLSIIRLRSAELDQQESPCHFAALALAPAGCR
jgi:hypothetical protein